MFGLCALLGLGQRLLSNCEAREGCFDICLKLHWENLFGKKNAGMVPKMASETVLRTLER